MAPPDLLLHVGIGETNARMLRRALGRLRTQLHAHGVGFVGHGALSRVNGVEGWRRSADADEAATGAFESDVTGLVDEQVQAIEREAGAPKAVVISSDHLLGRGDQDGRDERLFRPFAESSLTQVVRAVGPSRTRLVVYLRRQDRLMETCCLRALSNRSIPQLAERFPHRFEPVLDYDGLLRRLEVIPEVDEVLVRPVEPVGTSAASLTDDFLSVLSLSGRLDLAPLGDDLTPDPLYSNRAATMALDVAPYLDSARERRLLHAFLLEHFPGTDDASTRVLPAADRQRILEAYAPSNQRLFERYLPHLPPDSYASDEATAALVAAARAADMRSPRAQPRPPVSLRGGWLALAASLWGRAKPRRGARKAGAGASGARGRL